MQRKEKKEKEQEQIQGQSSIAKLQARLAGSQINARNEQKNTTSQELERLRNKEKQASVSISSETSTENLQREAVQQDLLRLRSGMRLPIMTAENSTTDRSQSSSEKVAAELKGLNVKSRGAQLFISSQQIQSKQGQATAEELERLKLAEGNVRFKAKMLEEFFNRSKQVLKEVKRNDTSRIAKETLTLPKEFETFVEQQNIFIGDVKKSVQADIRAYADSPKLQGKMNFSEFLKLSFSYRSYQVCLEQDFRRHAALNVQKRAKSSEDDHIIFLCGIPNQMAVQSLNYYRDFFKNLPAIEDIWKNAGAEIRNAEVRLIFAAKVYEDTNVLFFMLSNKDNPDYGLCCDLFEQAYKRYAGDAYLQSYISSGNGLDLESHPWKLNGYNRLSKPNASIDFNNITPVDNVHAEAIEQVKTRVEFDSFRMRN